MIFTHSRFRLPRTPRAQLGLLAIALLTLPAAQAAPCVNSYSVDIPLTYINIGGPAGQVTGNICTDGTVGALTAANLVSWDLTLTGTADFHSGDYHWSSAGGGTVDLAHLYSAAPLTATATELTWHFTHTSGGTYDYLGFISTVTADYGGGPFIQQHYLYWYQSGNLATMFFGYDNPDPTPGGGQATYTGDPNDRIGTLQPPPSVPEPGSLTLALLGLAALRKTMRRG